MKNFSYKNPKEMERSNGNVSCKSSGVPCILASVLSFVDYKRRKKEEEKVH